jgi:hypothetical protein
VSWLFEDFEKRSLNNTIAPAHFGEAVSGPPLIEIATHEAAHAVVAAHLGLSPIWVEIDPVTGRGEMTPETPWYPMTAQQRSLVAQAGSAAQCRLNGTSAEWTREGVKDRIRLEAYLANQHSELDPNDFTEIDRLLDVALWERIERLAQALLAQNRIELPALSEFLRT